MKAIYEDEMRQLQEVLQIEDSEGHDFRHFLVPSTGARLDLDNAIKHLYHFCATLPAREYVDMRPDFICYNSGTFQKPSISAKVILPLSVNEAVRIAASHRTTWLSEKNAIKDAAYEAYLALYRAGLVNDNLLPLLRHDPLLEELTNSVIESRPSLVAVSEQLDIWSTVFTKSL